MINTALRLLYGVDWKREGLASRGPCSSERSWWPDPEWGPEVDQQDPVTGDGLGTVDRELSWVPRTLRNGLVGPIN